MMSIGKDNGVERYAWQELTNEDKKYAEEHLNETDETRENAIAEIKRWLENCDDFLCAQIDDFLILRFLRVCKFNLEKTKDRIRNYYKQRSRLPEWFKNRDPFQPNLQELLDLGVCLPLRKPDSQGRLIIIVRGTRHDPKKISISDVMKLGLMGVELALKYYPLISIYGCRVFIDMIGTSVGHLAQYRPSILMNTTYAWQNSYPLRFQSMTIFNALTIFDIIAKIFKSLLTKKMRNRYQVYSIGSTQNCFKDIPADSLPVEYGGTGGTIKELAEYWKKLYEENRDWFINEENDQIIISNQ